MRILSLDSSQNSQSASIFDLETASLLAQKEISEADPQKQKERRQQKSSQYLPMIIEMFENTDLELRDIGLIGVTTGPGSFTGIRTALAVAKTLASELKLKIFAVNNFELLRFEHSKNEDETVALSAGRDAYFVSAKENFFSSDPDYKSSVLEFKEANRSILISKLFYSKENRESYLKDQAEVQPYYLRMPSIGKTHPPKKSS